MDNLFQSLMDKQLNEAFQTIQHNIEHLKQENQMLRKENNKLKTESYKDDEVIRLQNELEGMQKDYNRGFPISEKEYNAIQCWIDKHDKAVHHGSTKACAGGRYSYRFLPTGLGTIGVVRCSCGAEFTFQDMV